MSTPATTIDTKVEESVPEIDMEAEEVAPEVAEVLAEDPTPKTPRPKLTPIKESAKDKKDEQPAIPVCASPRRN